MYVKKREYIKRLVPRFRKETHATVVLSGNDEKASMMVPEIRDLFRRNGISLDLAVLPHPDQTSR